LLGGYCQATNGKSCDLIIVGILCNASTGQLCIASNGVDPLPVTYCLTTDNSTCFFYDGLACKQ
jgi:hypothetical protein